MSIASLRGALLTVAQKLKSEASDGLVGCKRAFSEGSPSIIVKRTLNLLHGLRDQSLCRSTIDGLREVPICKPLG